GDEPDSAAAELPRGGDGAQVDLGLAAARDALEERGQVAALPDRGREGVESARLLGRENQAGEPGGERRRGNVVPLFLFERQENALLRQRLEHRRARAGRGPDFGRGRGPSQVLQVRERLAPLAAAPQLLFPLVGVDAARQVSVDRPAQLATLT